jgi:hypothetical protein
MLACNPNKADRILYFWSDNIARPCSGGSIEQGAEILALLLVEEAAVSKVS